MKRFFNPGTAACHLFLLGYVLVCLFPTFLVIMNSFEDKMEIFNSPLTLPGPENFSAVGYLSVWEQGNFILYFYNSLAVTLGSLFLILLFGSMAAFALSEYLFRGSRAVFLFFAMGIMIPIRLGTIGILDLMVGFSLVNTKLALVLVYSAQGLPLAVFILTEFMRGLSLELKDAARVDGLSEYSIFFKIVLPLIRPALATIAVFTMLPVWNDLWFPLILAPEESVKTVTLGAQQFIGQIVTDWNAVLAALSIATLPVLFLYLVFSKQLIRGITSGAVK